MLAHHKRNLWFGEPNFSCCRLHRTRWRITVGCRFRFLVALARVPDLLVCAKHLFVAARTWHVFSHHAASAIVSGSVGSVIA